MILLCVWFAIRFLWILFLAPKGCEGFVCDLTVGFSAARY